MPINADKPLKWKDDIRASVDQFNQWFMDFAPRAFREARLKTTEDVVIKSKQTKRNGLPLLVEAKSAGDFTNVNKRRKEEAAKMRQLRARYGTDVRYILFLCGYFDTGYLGYEAAEGMDWVWEHRIDDLAKFGI